MPELSTLITPTSKQDSIVPMPELPAPELTEINTDEPLETAPALEKLEPLAQTDEIVILPTLDGSDQWVQDAVKQISPELIAWFNAEQLIKRYMLVINDFSQGIRLEKHMTFLKFIQPFSADDTAPVIFMTAKNYQRYNGLASAVSAVDVPLAVAFYKKAKPLLTEVFAEFSYPDDYTLDRVVIKAAEQILAAPLIDEPITLVKRSMRYKFADPALEALNPVQKQMIRMGPENTRLIQTKLQLLVDSLAE